MTRTAISVFSCFLAALSFSSPIASAQTRADVIGEEQALKAAAAHPYEPPKAERIFLAVKKQFLDTPDGLYPLIGSIYPGSGLAVGGGYRRFYGDRTFWDAKLLWSFRNSKLVELSTESPGHIHERIDLSARLGWREATGVAHYGIGAETSALDRTTFHLRELYAGEGIKARPVRWLVLGAQANYESYRPGEDPGEDESRLAGVGPKATYIHNVVSAGIDWRPTPGYARRGGLYEVTYHGYEKADQSPRFDRLEAEVIQHVPVLRENWVISVHGKVDSLPDNGSFVPLYLLPSLGGGTSLRGYPSWRFRDRNSLLLQGEFRWIPNRYGIDAALFYDAGKVTRTRRTLNFVDLTHDLGAEIRFHSTSSTPLRLGIARGTEGWKLVFGGTAAF